MLSLRRGLVLFLLLLAGAVAILALPGPAHAAAGCSLEAGGAGWTLDDAYVGP